MVLFVVHFVEIIEQPMSAFSVRFSVLDDGSLVEFDIPFALLQNPQSHFSKLVHETGKENAALLTKMAAAAQRKGKDE